MVAGNYPYNPTKVPYINLGSMGKCRVCKKNCDCLPQYCESCMEDLSEDENGTVPAKKKLIEKKQVPNKDKTKPRPNNAEQEVLMA